MQLRWYGERPGSLVLDRIRPRALLPRDVGGGSAAGRQASIGGARGAASFVRLGVDHILTGWDHLAFLLALLLAARGVRSPRRRGHGLHRGALGDPLPRQPGGARRPGWARRDHDRAVDRLRRRRQLAVPRGAREVARGVRLRAGARPRIRRLPVRLAPSWRSPGPGRSSRSTSGSSSASSASYSRSCCCSGWRRA